MKHFALLGDESLHALGSLIMAMEVHGFPPRQLYDILVPQLEKPTGGYRPIGVCSFFYRLWGKLRRDHCDEWGKANWRPYFDAGTGKCPVDQVWRAAVAAEEALATKETSAAIFFWDIT
eukprot:9038512-Heterocapsa_arctica.AAC.1